MANIEHQLTVHIDYTDLNGSDQSDLRDAAYEEEGAAVIVDEVVNHYGLDNVLKRLSIEDVVAHFGNDLLEHYEAGTLVDYAYGVDQEATCLVMTELLEGDD